MLKDFIKDLKDFLMKLEFIDSDLEILSAEVDLLEAPDGSLIDTHEVDQVIFMLSDQLDDLIGDISQAIETYSQGHQSLPFDSAEHTE